MAPFLPHDDMSFGDLLAFQRDKAGLTQQQLAQTLGIQYQQVSAYEAFTISQIWMSRPFLGKATLRS